MAPLAEDSRVRPAAPSGVRSRRCPVVSAAGIRPYCGTRRAQISAS